MIKTTIKIIYSLKLREEITIEYYKNYLHNSYKQIIHCCTDGLNIEFIKYSQHENDGKFSMFLEGLNYRKSFYISKNIFDIKTIKKIFTSLKYESFYKDKELENEL